MSTNAQHMMLLEQQRAEHAYRMQQQQQQMQDQQGQNTELAQRYYQQQQAAQQAQQSAQAMYQSLQAPTPVQAVQAAVTPVYSHEQQLWYQQQQHQRYLMHQQQQAAMMAAQQQDSLMGQQPAELSGMNEHAYQAGMTKPLPPAKAKKPRKGVPAIEGSAEPKRKKPKREAAEAAAIAIAAQSEQYSAMEAETTAYVQGETMLPTVPSVSVPGGLIPAYAAAVPVSAASSLQHQHAWQAQQQQMLYMAQLRAAMSKQHKKAAMAAYAQEAEPALATGLPTAAVAQGAPLPLPAPHKKVGGKPGPKPGHRKVPKPIKTPTRKEWRQGEYREVVVSPPGINSTHITPRLLPDPADPELLPPQVIKGIITRALPVGFPIEKGAVKNLHSSTQEFLHLLISEANFLRQEEQRLKTQLSMKSTFTRLDNPIPTVGLDSSLRLLDHASRDAILPAQASEEPLPGQQACVEGGGNVLAGRHVLNALVNLGFQEYASVLGLEMESLLLSSAVAGEMMERNCDHLIREEHIAEGKVEVQVESIPIPLNAETAGKEAPKELAFVGGGAGRRKKHASSAAVEASSTSTTTSGDASSASAPTNGWKDTSTSYSNVLSTETTRAALEQKAELLAVKEKWQKLAMSNTLYPRHPLTTPNYTPVPCALGSSCIEVVLLNRRSNPGASPNKHHHSHGHSHSLHVRGSTNSKVRAREALSPVPGEIDPYLPDPSQRKKKPSNVGATGVRYKSTRLPVDKDEEAAAKRLEKNKKRREEQRKKQLAATDEEGQPASAAPADATAAPSLQAPTAMEVEETGIREEADDADDTPLVPEPQTTAVAV